MRTSDSVWCCPVCGQPLAPAPHTLRCSAGHCFDRSRSGYVHLLPANRKHSAVPGDNPEMVRSRRAFLANGYYAHLLGALCDAAGRYLPENGVLLDAGCGEGYYTRGLGACRPDVQRFGVDISKTAVDLAARADKAAEYAVGSVFRLPVQDGALDALMSVFAPYAGEEFRRVLAPGGCLLMAIPGRRHLWELKCAVYDTPYENEVKDYALEGFSFCERLYAHREITLETPEEIRALFAMTPYAYRTGARERDRLAALTSLTTLTEFEVLIYRRG